MAARIQTQASLLLENTYARICSVEILLKAVACRKSERVERAGVFMTAQLEQGRMLLAQGIGALSALMASRLSSHALISDSKSARKEV